MPKEILNAVICASLLAPAVAISASDELTFTRVALETVGETNAGYVALADLNGDGTADIVAGLQWFEGPSWTRHPLYPTDAKTLIDIGKTVPYDVDRNGDLDLVANRRPQELFWFENPGPPSTGTWTKHPPQSTQPRRNHDGPDNYSTHRGKDVFGNSRRRDDAGGSDTSIRGGSPKRLR